MYNFAQFDVKSVKIISFKCLACRDLELRLCIETILFVDINYMYIQTAVSTEGKNMSNYLDTQEFLTGVLKAFIFSIIN